MVVRDKRYPVTLDDCNFFYLARVWEPAMGDGPLAYKLITVAANPESRSTRSAPALSSTALIERTQRAVRVCDWNRLRPPAPLTTPICI
jgi:hypothetical protein